MSEIIFLVIWFAFGILSLPLIKTAYIKYMGSDYNEEWERKRGITVLELTYLIFVVAGGPVSFVVFGLIVVADKRIF